MVIFIRHSKGYYHGESFSRFLHRLLKLPRLDVWRNASGKNGARLSVMQERKRLL